MIPNVNVRLYPRVTRRASTIDVASLPGRIPFSLERNTRLSTSLSVRTLVWSDDERRIMSDERICFTLDRYSNVSSKNKKRREEKGNGVFNEGWVGGRNKEEKEEEEGFDPGKFERDLEKLSAAALELLGGKGRRSEEIYDEETKTMKSTLIRRVANLGSSSSLFCLLMCFTNTAARSELKCCMIEMSWAIDGYEEGEETRKAVKVASGD
ncbi:hypothetical protein EV360DRAFT_76028 [Lentinula raphanica]|nr:hypothetical protein EV360DRAFT_76028 [Lentinula raphanica]